MQSFTCFADTLAFRGRSPYVTKRSTHLLVFIVLFPTLAVFFLCHSASSVVYFSCVWCVLWFLNLHAVHSCKFVKFVVYFFVFLLCFVVSNPFLQFFFMFFMVFMVKKPREIEKG